MRRHNRPPTSSDTSASPSQPPRWNEPLAARTPGAMSTNRINRISTWTPSLFNLMPAPSWMKVQATKDAHSVVRSPTKKFRACIHIFDCLSAKGNRPNCLLLTRPSVYEIVCDLIHRLTFSGCTPSLRLLQTGRGHEEVNGRFNVGRRPSFSEHREYRGLDYTNRLCLPRNRR